MAYPLFKLYHRLPPGLRSIAASIRGYQLRNLRFGPETERLAQEAIDRETFTWEQWKSWREEKLRHILRRAATRVPFYREQWSQRRGRQDLAAYKELGNWPVLRKEPLRASPIDFLAEDCDPRKMCCEHTSGSTGTPLTLWQSRETIRFWHALFEARWRYWYQVSRRDRWAILGGQLVVPVGRNHPPFWVWNAGLNQLYLSANHLSSKNARHYVRALVCHKVKYLWGYASALQTLASFALSQGITLPAMSAIISNAEPLYAHQRDIISKAFGGRAYDTYGMSEMVCAASECERGTMHLWPEVGIWEVLQDDADDPVKPGKVGRLVCTGLINADMPLVRYETGDRVIIAKPEIRCPCGRTLPILLSVEGRTDDVIVTPDGHHIGRMDPVFKAGFPIREAQIIQDQPDHLRVLIVPANHWNGELESSVANAIAERVGTMRISVERVASIKRGMNGKFKLVVSELPRTGAKVAHVNENNFTSGC